MKTRILTCVLLTGTLLFLKSESGKAQSVIKENVTGEKLLYHNITTDNEGHIIPWFSPDPGKSYDFVINATWNFWDAMRTDKNGLPYYMNHQV